MGQQRAELTPGASPWHQWGAELRRCRDARHLSLEQLGARAHVTRSYLSKLERGERSATRQIAIACDQALDLAGTLLNAWDRAAAKAGDGTAADDLQRVHVSSRGAHVSNRPADLVNPIPGHESSDDQGTPVLYRQRNGRIAFVTVPRRTFLRSGIALGAGAAMSLGPAETKVSAGSAHRSASTYGATPVEHFRRTRRLLIDSDNLLGPRRVIPTVHENIAVIHSLRREADGSDRRDLLELQTQFAEFAAWLHQDVGDHRAAQFWLDRALQWSHTVGDGELTCYVMARKSQLAGEMKDLADVVDLADAAQQLARPHTRLAAIGQTYGAFGHALRGEVSASESAFEQALAVVDDLPEDPSPWGSWLDGPYVEVHRAQGLEALGEHDAAAAAFANAIRSLPAGYHRDRGVYLAREAVSHAGAGSPEQAATVGLQALAVAEDTGSGRILNQLAQLDAALIPWKTLPEVADFRGHLDDIVLHEVEELI